MAFTVCYENDTQILYNTNVDSYDTRKAVSRFPIHTVQCTIGFLTIVNPQSRTACVCPSRVNVW